MQEKALFYTGCGMYPPWHTVMLTYCLSHVFDIALVALLICTTLVEMRQRRGEMQNALKAAFSKLASGGKPKPAALAVGGIVAGSAANSPDSAAAAMWMTGAAAGGVADDEDAPLPPVSAAKDHQQQQQQQQQLSGGSTAGKHNSSEITRQADQQQQHASSLTPWDAKQLGTHPAAAAAMPPALHLPTPSSLGAFATASGPYPSIDADQSKQQQWPCSDDSTTSSSGSCKCSYNICSRWRCWRSKRAGQQACKVKTAVEARAAVCQGAVAEQDCWWARLKAVRDQLLASKPDVRRVV
jgi:hypothetical protein